MVAQARQLNCLARLQGGPRCSAPVYYFRFPVTFHTWTTRTVDRHNFAGLPLNPYFVAGLIHGGGLMLLQYRLGFELRRSDVVIMAASVAVVVLVVFSF